MKRKKVLFVLQNPWRRGARQEVWDGPSWQWALWKSHTGKRLREYIPEGIAYGVINANPVAADNGRVVLPVNVEYVRRCVADFEPDLVVLLGKEAARLTRHLSGKVLCLPHPCYRLLTRDATSTYQRQVSEALA